MQKRILFLKDSLEKSPYMTSYQNQSQYISALKLVPSEMLSPKESSLANLVRVDEPPKKNFFQTPSVLSLASVKNKQSQSVIRKMYDSETGTSGSIAKVRICRV